jgi:hypothetical protein
VLRRIFGLRREEVVNIIRVIKSRRMRWEGHAECMGDMRYAYKALVGKPKVKRPHRRPRSRWEDNIRMDPGETGREGVDGFYLPQDGSQWRALVKTVMNLRVP